MNAYKNSRREDYIEIIDAKVKSDWSHFGGENNDRGETVHYIELELDDATADFLNENEFNVRMWVPKDNQKDPVKHLKVRLPFYLPETNKDWLNSKVYIVSMDKPTVKTPMEHGMWKELDDSIIDHANLILRLYKGRTRTGTPFKTAQLVTGTFYTSGTRVRDFEPDYDRDHQTPTVVPSSYKAETSDFDDDVVPF